MKRDLPTSMSLLRQSLLTTSVLALLLPSLHAQPATVTVQAGAIILKLVNGGNSPNPVRIELVGGKELPPTAEVTVLAGPDPMAVDDFGNPSTVLPRVSRLPVAPAFDYEAPANSLTVIRIAR